jgi:hypothetical protein
MAKSLKRDFPFVLTISAWLSGDVPEDQKHDLEVLFGISSTPLEKDCNRFLLRTYKGIVKGVVSIEGLTLKDLEVFDVLLNSKRLNPDLQESLRSVLFKKDI